MGGACPSRHHPQPGSGDAAQPKRRGAVAAAPSNEDDGNAESLFPFPSLPSIFPIDVTGSDATGSACSADTGQDPASAPRSVANGSTPTSSAAEGSAETSRRTLRGWWSRRGKVKREGEEVFAFEVSRDLSADIAAPAKKNGRPDHFPRRMRSVRVPVNSPVATRYRNDYFDGQLAFMHRPLQAGEPFHCQPYFNGKKRLWELRVQGRFRHVPRGDIWAGLVLRDFDYSIPPTSAASVLAGIAVPLLKAFLRQDLYFTWGDRGDQAGWLSGKEPELAGLTGQLPGLDQIIVTKRGEAPPNLAGFDWADSGPQRRKAASISAWRDEVTEILSKINTDDTYTFCLWGPSQYYNAFLGRICGLIPFKDISINDFMQGFPLHFVMYELVLPETEDAQDQRHLESRKKYFLDIMVWNTGLHCPTLPARYSGIDAAGNDCVEEETPEPEPAADVAPAPKSRPTPSFLTRALRSCPCLGPCAG